MIEALHFMLKSFGKHNLHATVHPDNKASLRIMELLGMKQSGVKYKHDEIYRLEFEGVYDPDDSPAAEVVRKL
jgi:RimJ/RimL family protein N-acetyltransferase